MAEQIDPKIYKYFADIVFTKTGIFYPEKDYYRLDSRLNKLVKRFECENTNEVYQKFVTNTSKEMMEFLIDICTNNETYFFRDQKPFDLLVENLIPNVLERKTSIKMWCCASSTGQEPLSVIMSILEKSTDFKLHQLDFMASDISKQALEKCESGVYSSLDVQRGLPIQLLIKYFEKVDENNWKIKPEIHSHVKYKPFNLLSDLYPVNEYDIVFCRNVLIYQDKENKQKILSSIMNAMKPGAYLVFGAGESLIGMEHNLEQAKFGQNLAFQKAL